MLKQRIITALLLLAFLIPAVLHPDPDVFALAAMCLIAAGAWEWARLNQIGQTGAITVAVFCAVACCLTWVSGMTLLPLKPLWLVSGCAWVFFGAWILWGGTKAWSRLPQTLRLVSGIMGLWVAWVAVAKARMLGINFLLSVLVLVWAADIFAYFVGRTLGGRIFHRKLAPSISPGKTWEGACGAVVGVFVCAFLWRELETITFLGAPSLYTRLGQGNMGFMLVALLFLTMMSIVGDLVESLFKRSAGVKDSSGLLPGHGGVLDRIDALLPILPLAIMMTSA